MEPGDKHLLDIIKHNTVHRTSLDKTRLHTVSEHPVFLLLPNMIARQIHFCQFLLAFQARKKNK